MDAQPIEQILGDLDRWGRIASVTEKTCTVIIGDMVSPPLPWFALRAGKIRKWSPPSKDEQCLVICPEGDLASGLVFPGIVSTQFPFPDTNPDIEVTEYADGARLSYDESAHALSVKLPAGATVIIIADGGIKLTGDVEVSGSLRVSKAIEAGEDVTADGISLKNHVTTGVKAGTDLSGKPK